MQCDYLEICAAIVLHAVIYAVIVNANALLKHIN